MKKKEKLKSNSDNDDTVCENKSIPNICNNKKVSKISDISLFDQRIAKNITEL
ncbi:hypothetical protein C1645_830651 [Glomus cerebriforme]|uniref:Uncharacterized protein n=1 Tax=Glomus cerebriforme TaxID=658196 RepID=A0A397SLP6_9GLOM|nr:hypothetical protein C1645_830651 [Glomus cerebriforme]